MSARSFANIRTIVSSKYRGKFASFEISHNFGEFHRNSLSLLLHSTVHALQWLQRNNELYEKVTINLENIDHELSNLCDHEQETESNITNCSQTRILPGYCDGNDGDCGKEQGVNEQAAKGKRHCFQDGNLDNDHVSRDYDDDDDCEREEPLNEHRAATCETCLQSIIPDYRIIISDGGGSQRSAGNEIFSVAPGENKHPVSMMTDRHCEELAFPVLFPKGRFGYKMDRKEKLTPVRYFNARLMHYSGRFATNPEYLFFVQFIIEQKKVSDNINIQGCCLTVARSPGAPRLCVWATNFPFKEPGRAPKTYYHHVQ